MKQYILIAAGTLAMLAILTTTGFGQDSKTETTTTIRHNNDDIIVIKPKANTDTKLNIEINGADVKINGKPLADYRNDDVIITKRKQTAEKREVEEWDNEPGPPPPPRTRFRGGANVYGYSSPDNLGALEALADMNSNKAFLGVGTEKARETEGASIISVSDESAAEKAGLKEGDIITKINDNKISSPEELTKTIGRYKPDEQITITYKRDKKELKTNATLTKRKFNGAMPLTVPDMLEFKKFNFDNNMNYNFAWGSKPRLGLKAQETEDGKGLKVLDVDNESAAEKAGIKEGDIITSFDGSEVNNIDKLRELSKPALDKGNFKVNISRDGKAQEINVKIPKNLKTTSL